MRTISDGALAALSSADIIDGWLYLTAQLDRKVYAEVNAALATMGGKWNRKAKAHIFEEDPTDLIEDMILTGGYVDKKKDLQQFDTPPDIAQKVIDAAGIKYLDDVLEPSAGLGRLAVAACKAGGFVHCIEIDDARVEHLKTTAHLGKVRRSPGTDFASIIQSDFLKIIPVVHYDRVVMNPPFTKGQDVKHVMHAYDFLKPGGTLVAIMSPAFTFRTTEPFVGFRAWLEGKMEYLEDLPEDAFKSAGTNVRTVMVVLNRPL